MLAHRPSVICTLEQLYVQFSHRDRRSLFQTLLLEVGRLHAITPCLKKDLSHPPSSARLDVRFVLSSKPTPPMCQKRRSVPVVGRVWRGSGGTSDSVNETGKEPSSIATSTAPSIAIAPATATTTTTIKTTTKTVTKTPIKSTRNKSYEGTRKGSTDIDTRTHGMIATALAAAVHVDLDQHGRPSGDIDAIATKNISEGWDMDAHQRADALIKLGAISRRRSAVCAGDYVSSDLCGRGDPVIFARMRKTGHLASDPAPIQAPDQTRPIDAVDGTDDSTGNTHHLVKSDLDAIAHAQLHRQPTELPPTNGRDDNGDDTEADVNRKLALPQVKSERRASRSKTTRERLRRTKSHQVRHSKQPLYKSFTKWFTSRRRKTA